MTTRRKEGRERPAAQAPGAGTEVEGITFDAGEERLGPVLYNAPPFDIDMVYAAPAFDTDEQSSVIGGHTLTVSVSVQVGSTRTTRRLTVQRIHGWHDWKPRYVAGFCHLRQDTRHFRVDRIRELSLADSARREGNAEWFFRCRIAKAHGVRPIIHVGEGVILATALAEKATVHLRRDGSAVADAYAVEIQRIGQYGNTRLSFCGHATRARTEHRRAWSGDKTFYVGEGLSVFRPDGTQIADVAAFLYDLAGFAADATPTVVDEGGTRVSVPW